MAKWLEFVDVSISDRKTKIFEVFNKDNGSYLGAVKWHGAFRQYSFFPASDCIFEKTCLRDISKFMEDLMEERKNARLT